MPSVRIRDGEMISALIRCVRLTPGDELPLVGEYLTNSPEASSADMCRVILTATPEQLAQYASDMLGVDCQYDSSEWHEWLITPNANYAGFFDDEPGMKASS